MGHLINMGVLEREGVIRGRQREGCKWREGCYVRFYRVWGVWGARGWRSQGLRGLGELSGMSEKSRVMECHNCRVKLTLNATLEMLVTQAITDLS